MYWAPVANTIARADTSRPSSREIRYGRALDLSDDDWEYSVDAVLRQFFNLSRAAGRVLVAQGSGGSLVSISSVSGIGGAPFHAPYGAAKAGLMSLTRSLAIELAAAGIRVNSVAPGAVATPRVVERLGGRSPDGLPLFDDGARVCQNRE